MSDISFTLDHEKGKKGHYLVIQISEGINAPKRHLYRDMLLSLIKDRDVANFLIKEELAYLGISLLSSQASTLPLNRIHVAPQQSNAAIKLLATKAKLLWKGKKLIVDPFTKVDFIFEVSSAPEDAIRVDGKVSIGGKECTLDKVEWIFPGSPAWIIKDGICYTFAKDIHWKWIEMVYPSSATLKGSAKEKFYDQFEDGDFNGAPSVVWKTAPSKAEQKEAQVLPFLMLKDPNGAFADLWMDYGDFGKVAYHDTAPCSFRKQESEKSWEKDLLETDFTKKIVDSSHYYCPLDKVAKSLTFLIEIGWQILDAKGRLVVRQTAHDLSIKMQDDSILVQGKVSYGDHNVDLSNVLGSFNRREKFIDLSPNTVGLLDPMEIEKEWGSLSEEEIVKDSIKVKKGHFGILCAYFEKNNTKISSDVQELRAILDKDAKISATLPSEDFMGTLYPYQQEGLNWLAFLEKGGLHGLLADEMGLGKTVQVLSFLSLIKTSLPVLIIMPTSLLFNWRKEFEKFLPTAQVYVHSGKERLKDENALKNAQIILTSYAVLRQDEALFQSIEYRAIILDEAQVIKNPESQTASICFNLKGSFRLAMTGTPVENRLDDLWSLFYFLLPEVLGDRKEFNAKMLSAQSDSRYLTQLKKKVRPFILRRTKSEVAADLPPKHEQTVWVEMQEGQRAIYEEWLRKNRQGLLKKVELDGLKAHRMEILEAILRLRQLCCHPLLVDATVIEESAKFERLFEDLEVVVEDGKKVLVYSQFTTMLHLIEKEVKKRGWSYVLLDGSSKDREALVEKFQNDPKTSIFLLSLKAGGVGLNLTAADYIFLYDPWWNEAVERQAIDRAHRFGREGAVIARRYVMVESIEEKMMKLKEHKTQLAKGVLNFEEQITELTLQDLYDLIS